MRAEHRHRAVRNLIELLDEACTFALERFHDMTIVDNLVAHIDRLAILLQRALDDVDGAYDAGAEAAWLGKNDAHTQGFLWSALLATSFTPVQWRNLVQFVTYS